MLWRRAEDNVIVELDESGRVMGIELWGVRKRGLLKQLVELTVALESRRLQN